MLHRIYRLKFATSKVLNSPDNSKHQSTNLSEEEYKILKEIIKVLKPFYQITQTLCAEKYVTISIVYPSIIQLRQEVLITYLTFFYKRK